MLFIATIGLYMLDFICILQPKLGKGSGRNIHLSIRHQSVCEEDILYSDLLVV